MFNSPETREFFMLAIYSSILSISPAERIVDTKKQSLNFSYFRLFSLIFIIQDPQTPAIVNRSLSAPRS